MSQAVRFKNELKLKEVLYPNHFQKYHDFEFLLVVLLYLVVLSEIEVSAIKTEGLGAAVKESLDNNKLQTLFSFSLLIADFCTVLLEYCFCNLFLFSCESCHYHFLHLHMFCSFPLLSIICR